MNIPLRVLLVAASREDSGPPLEEIQHAGHEVFWELVRTPAEMEDALAQKAWDFILWIGDPPGFDPEEAFALAARSGRDASFLVVGEGPSPVDAEAQAGLTRTALPLLGVTVERKLADARVRQVSRQSREALRESESRFWALAEGTGELILTVDADGLVLFANRAAERVFGYPISAIVGRPVARLLPGLVAPGDAEPSVEGSGKEAATEQTGIHSSGRGIPLEVSVGSFRRNGHRLVTIVGRDVGERNLVREALHRSEGRVTAMIEAALDAIVTIDAEGNVLEFNASAERTFGYSRESTLGRPMSELIVPPAFRERHRLGMERYLATGETTILGRRLEMTAMRADGSEIPVELTVTRVPSDGPPVFTAYLRDISDRRQAEIALRDSEERFRVAAQISSDHVYEWNLQTGEVLFLHSRHGSGQGLPTTREVWEQLVHPADRPRVFASVRRTLDDDQPFFEEYRIVLPDGSLRYRVGYGKVLRDADGRAVKWIGVNKDVTERRRTQAALKESEQKLRTLVGNMPVVLFALDSDGVFTHSEGKGLEAVGLTPGEVVGRSVWELYSEEPGVLENVRRALAGENHTGIVRMGEIEFETRYAPYRDAAGRVLGVIGVATDVTEQRRADQALRASESRYRMLFERNLAGVFRSTLEGQILDCNESFARMFGYASPEEVLLRPARNFYLEPAERQDFLALLSKQRSLTNFEMCARRRDGTPVWVLENATLIEGPDGALSLIEGTVIDITERKRAEEQVKHLAFHDALTGLPNRLLLNDRLKIALAQAHRSRQKLATFYLDLDRFKVINDSLGHTVGDALLRRVAQRLRRCVREGDTVARLGGDEFVILASRFASDNDVETVARKVLAAIRLPFAVEGRDFFLTTSIGVSLHPNDGTDAETLL
ncbi:MAG TPA: PAS domain S-box protein, partial [Thermoanaerobaculia bacterium]|nr:PAS domain S-box protein [Thermoanaerobaculia bacterium]